MSVSEEKQSEVIEAFNSMSRYLDDLLNVDNRYFDGLIGYTLASFKLNKAFSSETESPYLDLHLSILDGFIACKIYNKLDCKFSLLGWGGFSSSILRCLYFSTNSVCQSV